MHIPLIAKLNRFRKAVRLSQSPYSEKDLDKILGIAGDVALAHERLTKAKENYDVVDLVAPQSVTEFFPPITVRNENYMQGSRIGMVSIRAAYHALFLGLSELGVRFNEVSPSDADLCLNWSYKMHFGEERRRIYLEHGWLPRSYYQISPDGTNALSHVAKNYRFRKPGDREKREICNQLDRLRRRFYLTARRRSVEEFLIAQKTPFVLFTLQLANDANLRYSDSEFSGLFGQSPSATKSLVENCVAKAEKLQIPYQLLFKKHPLDPNDYSYLVDSKGCQFLPAHQSLNTHELFATGLCRGVVAINSNSLHEASVWGIPGVALGSLLWSEEVGTRPYPSEWDAQSKMGTIPIEALSYLRNVLRNQWTLDDFLNPVMLQKLIESRGYCCPADLREQL